MLSVQYLEDRCANDRKPHPHIPTEPELYYMFQDYGSPGYTLPMWRSNRYYRCFVARQSQHRIKMCDLFPPSPPRPLAGNIEAAKNAGLFLCDGECGSWPCRVSDGFCPHSTPESFAPCFTINAQYCQEQCPQLLITTSAKSASSCQKQCQENEKSDGCAFWTWSNLSGSDSCYLFKTGAILSPGPASSTSAAVSISG